MNYLMSEWAYLLLNCEKRESEAIISITGSYWGGQAIFTKLHYYGAHSSNHLDDAVKPGQAAVQIMVVI